MDMIMLAVLLALAGGAVAIAEARDRPVRRALREKAAAQN